MTNTNTHREQEVNVGIFECKQTKTLCFPLNLSVLLLLGGPRSTIPPSCGSFIWLPGGGASLAEGNRLPL